MSIKSLDQLDFNKTYTYADYLTWEVKERLELLRGKIALMSPAPNLEHQRISRKLFLKIGAYLETRNCEVFAAPFDVRLKRNDKSSDDREIYTVVQPDICVVCDPEKLDTRGCLGAPDLVIEILSPGNTQHELREKYCLYEENSVQEYWVVSPPERFILIYLLNPEGKFLGQRPLTIEDTLTTAIMPGLEIQLRKVLSGG